MTGHQIRWALLALGAALIALTWWATGRQLATAPPPPVLSELPAFSLVGRDGETVSGDDLLGRPWVADLIFTRCPLSCPRMTEAMAGLGPDLERAGGARRVSISVDPEHDTPEVLSRYAAERGIDDPDWLFLTGERAEIHSLARGGFLLPFEEADAPEAGEAVIHSTRFVLVDAAGRVRGYYDPFDVDDRRRLLAELAAIDRE